MKLCVVLLAILIMVEAMIACLFMKFVMPYDNSTWALAISAGLVLGWLMAAGGFLSAWAIIEKADS